MVSKSIAVEITSTKEFIKNGVTNPHLEDMTEILNEFWTSIDGLGSDLEKAKDFKLVSTKVVRAVFKIQNNMVAILKDRKKVVKAEYEAKTAQA